MRRRLAQARSTLTTATVLRAAAIALAVWIPVLVALLAADGTPRGQALAWALLDVAELTGLVATASGLVRRAWWVPVAAGMTAGLLATDAVVDIATAASTADLAGAIAMAVLAELPLAALCARQLPLGLLRARPATA